MTKRKCRNLKVVGQSGYNYKETPTITLKGKWLEEIGFQIGNYVQVSCEDGKLMITLDSTRMEMEASREAFMDAELKKLAKRYELEKEQIREQFVAEQKERYGA